MGIVDLLIWLIPGTIGQLIIETVIVLIIFHGIRKLIEKRKRKK